MNTENALVQGPNHASKYRVMPKIFDYATQHAEAGYEETVKNQEKKTFSKT